MLTKKNLKSILVPTLLALSCLNSCATTNYNCPTWPIAGENVAKELEAAGELNNTWEWIGRLNKLRQELELCKKNPSL